MTAINIKAFRGKVPRSSPRLLKPNYAVEALNAKLTSGRLDPLRGLALKHTTPMTSAIKTMWRYSFRGLLNWLVWSRPVDVVRSPTAQDSRGRFFYTGDGEPRMSTYADAITGGGPFPAAFYVLGVHVPTVAPIVGVTGGSGATEARAYLYTFKTQYEEESAPSPATVLLQFANATSWNLSGMELPPTNAGTISAASSVSADYVRVTLNTTRGLQADEEVTLAGVAGMTSLNGTFKITAVISATQIDVPLATAQAYTAGGTWARVAPHNLTGMKRCIYRTVGTNTDYKLVAEIDAATTTYADSVAATALGRNLPSMTSFTPPKNGHSLVALANGALAMIAGNELCFSEQYKPYSWPLGSRYAFAGTGVALVAAGNSAIVLTDTYPVVAVATVPEAASLSRLPTYAPCVSKAGVADVGGAAVYPSHDGLYLATASDARNLTDGLYRIDEWQEIQPATFRAAYFDQRYYAVHDTWAGGTGRILVLDTSEPDSVAEVDETADCLYANPLDGKLYASQGREILEWDSNDASRYQCFWQSMDFQFGRPLNFACAQVHAQFSQIVPVDDSILVNNTALLADGILGVLGAIGATEVGVVPIGGSNLQPAPDVRQNRVQFSLLKDGEIFFSTNVDSSKPFRVPSGEKSETYAIQISSSLPVYGVTVAQSMGELGRVSE